MNTQSKVKDDITTARIYASDLHHLKIIAAVENILPLDAISQVISLAISTNPKLKVLTNSNITEAASTISKEQ